MEMDTENGDDNVALSSMSITQSVDEARAQVHTSGDKMVSTDTNYDTFHFWRVAPMIVDQSLILAVCGEIAFSNMLNQLSVSKRSTSDSLPSLSEGKLVR